MLPTIKGVKLGMTSVFDATGTTAAVTLIKPYRAVVTQVMTPEKHGYAAVQLAYCESTPKHVNKPLKGVLDRAGAQGNYRKLYEVRIPESELSKYHAGDVLEPSDFLLAWAEVDVVGTSKGKGFAGAVKRHHFAGQCRTHGDPDNRRSMSNGGTDAARVFKGSRRAGHMGFERITLRACSVYEYFRKLNVMVVQGSVPGPIGGELTLTLHKEFTPEEQAEHEKMITLDEHQMALIDTETAAHQKHAGPAVEVLAEPEIVVTGTVEEPEAEEAADAQPEGEGG